MSSAFIAKLGLIFLGLGLCATFLMYWLWGFPFDKATKTSSAPKPLMYTHRVLGYLFLITYVAIMWYMVPRLWEYQVEFPARTVAHIVLGITIGFLLIIKISIMRFFRHFEEWMPYLGTAIMLFTVLLLGLSVPFVFQERALADAAVGGSVYSAENSERVTRLLPTAGLPENASFEALATEGNLRVGRGVLLNNCVRCHDLKTILAKPRTPSNWYRTVVRMAEKPALFEPITLEEQWQVTAYLVAITPDLQRSLKQIRSMEEDKKDTLAAASKDSVMPEDEGGEAGMPNIDPAKATETYEDICSQCHELSDVDADPPETAEDIDPLIKRMIENGMEAEPEELRQVKWYLLERFVNKSIKE